MINVDFADVKTVMSEAGSALMGMGIASGENRAVNAAKQAITSPLLELSINGATGILFNITGGPDLSMLEVDEAAQIIYDAVDPNANIIFGTSIDDTLEEGSVKFTVLATGFDSAKQSIVRSTSFVPSKPNNPPTQVEEPKIIPHKSDTYGDEEDQTLEVPAFLRRR